MGKATKKRQTWAIWENTVLAFQTLRDRSFRSFLTVIGVSIGVIIIISVASVLNGFRQGVVDKFSQWGTDNIYITRFPLISMTRPGREMHLRKLLTLKDAWAIRDECPAVLAVNPEKMFTLPVKCGDKEMIGANIHGAFPDAQYVVNMELIDGRFYTNEENRQRTPVCVVGWNVTQTLFPRQAVLGKSIMLQGRQIRIIGVLNKLPSAASAEENPDDSLIFIPYDFFRQMFPWYQDHVIGVRARKGQLRLALEQVEEVMRRRRHVPWKAPNDFDINTANSMTAAFDNIVFATLSVMFALSTVAFMVGGVGVMNVMFASVKERTREIGVRRAIGARRRDIIWQFLTEAMAMTGTGGLIGIALGEGLMRGLMYFLPAVPCATPMWARLFGFFGSVGIGLLFGLWPAISAACLDPIKALRYE